MKRKLVSGTVVLLLMMSIGMVANVGATNDYGGIKIEIIPSTIPVDGTVTFRIHADLVATAYESHLDTVYVQGYTINTAGIFVGLPDGSSIHYRNDLSPIIIQSGVPDEDHDYVDITFGTNAPDKDNWTPPSTTDQVGEYWIDFSGVFNMIWPDGVRWHWFDIPGEFTVTPPPPERGKITGGGHGDIEVNGIPGGSFGFNVMWFSKDPAPTGELNYVDHATGMHVHAHEMWGLEVWEVLVGNKPWPRRFGDFCGPCTVDGEAGYTFRVIIEDNGEPGKEDCFWIRVTDGMGFWYEGGGPGVEILCGNIQIHKPPK